MEYETLDDLIAIKIMGWIRGAQGGWSPSSVILDSWQVVEEMKSRGYYISIQNCHPKKEWCVLIVDNKPTGNPKEGIGEGQGEICVAICLAALDVLRIKLPKNSIYRKTRSKRGVAPRKITGSFVKIDIDKFI